MKSTAITTNIGKTLFFLTKLVLYQIIVFVYVYPETLLNIKRIVVLLSTSQHITSYSSTIKFICLISENVVYKTKVWWNLYFSNDLLQYRRNPIK